MVPGVMPDRTPASIARARVEADEHLPPIPGTLVDISMFTPDLGRPMIRDTFGGEPALAAMNALLDTVADGDEPTIIIAYRSHKKGTP